MTTCDMTDELSGTLLRAADTLDFARQIQSSLASLAASGCLWRPC